MPAVSAVSSGACCGSTPNSPSTPGTVTCSTDSASLSPSGVTISSFSVSATFASRLRCRALHALPGFLGLLDVAAHVERLLGQVVESAGKDLLKPGDRFFERNVLPGAARELRGHEERLREEALDLASPRHDELVVFAELV